MENEAPFDKKAAKQQLYNTFRNKGATVPVGAQVTFAEIVGQLGKVQVKLKDWLQAQADAVNAPDADLATVLAVQDKIDHMNRLFREAVVDQKKELFKKMYQKNLLTQVENWRALFEQKANMQAIGDALQRKLNAGKEREVYNLINAQQGDNGEKILAFLKEQEVALAPRLNLNQDQLKTIEERLNCIFKQFALPAVWDMPNRL
ncbi:MAG: hypothetical protein K2X94_05125 [Amoebophilaceae bacterium]|nr:hypothetical protein [Amoebophilaceae bacterium]